MTVTRNGRPIEFGLAETATVPRTAPSEFSLALVGGAATAATGWFLEEVWSAFRGRKRRRRR
jgi:hypothetical protein